MLKTKKCPLCKEMMQIVVDPEKVPLKASNFIWSEHMMHKCYYCDYMEDLKGNVIRIKVFTESKNRCSICKTKMHSSIYDEKAKSVWAGQEVFLCTGCGNFEDKYGNKIPVCEGDLLRLRSRMKK